MELVSISTIIDQLWEKYDQECLNGNKDLAETYAVQAFQLLERLPENQVYLKDIQ